MTAERIIQSLARLLQEQRTLHQLAIEKTEILKKGELDALNRLLKEEEKQVKLLQKEEELRQKAVEQFLADNELTLEDVTMTSLLKFVSKEEGDLLQELGDKLNEEIDALKKRNELNQALILQSLQFVNATIQMLVPEPTSATYNRPKDKRLEDRQASIFDSRA